MIVVCDKCNEEFTTKLEERFLGEEIQEIYFTCSNCGHEYFVDVSDSYTRALKKKISGLEEQNKKHLKEKRMKAIQKLQRELKRETHKLKQQMDSESK